MASQPRRPQLGKLKTRLVVEGPRSVSSTHHANQMKEERGRGEMTSFHPHLPRGVRDHDSLF